MNENNDATAAPVDSRAQRDEDGALLAIETLLAEAGEGFKFSLHRMKPGWCKGWLATEEHTPGAPLSLEEIREEWGGGQFKVHLLDRAGRFVAAKYFSIAGAPREMGRPMKSPDDIEAERKAEAKAMQGNPSLDLKDIFQIMQKASSPNTDMMRLMIDLQNKGNDQGGLSQLLQFAEAIKQIQGLFPQDGGSGGGGTDLMGLFSQLMQSGLAEKLINQERAPAPRPMPAPQILRPARPVVPVPQPTPNPDPMKPATATTGNEEDEGEEIDLADELAALDPADAMQVFSDALERMTPEKQAQVIALLQGQQTPAKVAVK